MKRDSTTILLGKAFCYLVIGAGTPLGAAMAQWNDTGQWPPGVSWVVIIGACAVGGANNLLAFFSQSYGNWKQPNGNGNGNGKPAPPAP
jgi:hypothetical protein